MKKLPFVIVEWYDATSETSWVDLDDMKKEKLTIVTDYGFLIPKNKKEIIISSQYSSDYQFGNRTAIKKNWIKSIKRVNIWKLTGGKNAKSK